VAQRALAAWPRGGVGGNQISMQIGEYPGHQAPRYWRIKMGFDGGWVFFSAHREEEDFVSTRIYFAAIQDRETAIDAACDSFGIDLKSTEIVSIEECNDKLKEQARGVKPGEVELLTVVNPPDAEES
jgi:hypothetical protein